MRKKTKTNQYKKPAIMDFNLMPIPVMCQAIQSLIDNLESRGFPVYDFDNKDKTVKQIGMIGGKVYFLATKEKEDRHGKET